MKVRTTNLLAITAVLAVPGSLLAAESGLMGIKLYDSGVKVVQKFGSPNDIEAITFDTQAAGGGGGGNAGGGGGGGGFSGGGGAGNQTAEARLPGGYVVPPMGMRQMGGIVPPGREGGGRPGGGGASAGGGGTTGSTATQYVRWIYRRGAGSSVNFVLNKFNKVVQIEVIGISNSAARTSKGITLGSAMASVIQKYGDPDGYDIANDYFMVRFLRTHNVAFRFARENNNTPYRCTGIVVSAGKA
ncbi:MAG: hypothetical protein KatS3mg015_0739 [Fimbriimonadales bacterium]|nr:MAG: hypothetical protein KatS3mg015_0739 [Fimbriimonadales bacterium]